jgi:hypothetical protein
MYDIRGNQLFRYRPAEGSSDDADALIDYAAAKPVENHLLANSLELQWSKLARGRFSIQHLKRSKCVSDIGQLAGWLTVLAIVLFGKKPVAGEHVLNRKFVGRERVLATLSQPFRDNPVVGLLAYGRVPWPQVNISAAQGDHRLATGSMAAKLRKGVNESGHVQPVPFWTKR